MNVEALKPVVEAILMASEEPVSLDRLGKLVESDAPIGRDALREALAGLAEDYDGRGIELAEVASGWRFRVRTSYAEQVGRLWEERRPRYSRAFMETLAIIAYRQPITRGEIEHIRGVAVSTSIMRQLLEREWVRVVGHRDVPGRPSVYATTREFLDYFGLRSLEQLPTLAELKDIGDLNTDLFADAPTIAAIPARTPSAADGDAAGGDADGVDETQATGPTPGDAVAAEVPSAAQDAEQAAAPSGSAADAESEDDDDDAQAGRPAATG